MPGWLVVTLWVLGATLLLAVLAGALLVLGMRYKVPVVLDLVRRNNRRMINPRQMRTAGTPGAQGALSCAPSPSRFVVSWPLDSRWSRPVVDRPSSRSATSILPAPRISARSSWISSRPAAP